jgi:hypothetical protein
MPEYIGMYFAGSEQLVSSEDMTNPIQLNLRTDLEEEDEIRLYLEAEPNYQVQDVIVSIEGITSDMWALAADDKVYNPYGSEINLGLVGNGETNRIYFWAKAKTVNTETPKKDVSVNLMVNGVVEPL